MKHKKTVLSIVFCAVLVVACIRPSGINKRIDPNTPTLGNLNGVKMAIPLKYQFFPIEYEGDEIWNSEWQKKNRDRTPTPDMKIRVFSLLLHLPDYSIFNKENAKNWHHQSSQIGLNQDWITVNVAWQENIINLGHKDWLKGFIVRGKHIYSTRPSTDWHYEVAEENVYGLRHETLVGSTPTFFDFDMQSSHKELYYDEQGWSSEIECQRMIVEPFSESTCTQTYILPDLNSIISIEYNPQHLKNWREIKERTTSIIRQFEIKSSNNRTRIN